MPTITEAQARSAVQRGTPAPVYLLVGDDQTGKDAFVDLLTALVEPDLQALNLQRFYANERSIDEIVAAARTLPFLGARRVIIAQRCEVFLKPKGRAAASDDDAIAGEQDGVADAPAAAGPTGELERYLSSPAPENV